MSRGVSHAQSVARRKNVSQSQNSHSNAHVSLTHDNLRHFLEAKSKHAQEEEEIGHEEKFLNKVEEEIQ